MDTHSAWICRLFISDGRLEETHSGSDWKNYDIKAYPQGDTIWFLAVSNSDRMLYCSQYDIIKDEVTTTSSAIEDNLSLYSLMVREDGRYGFVETFDYALYLIDFSDLSLTRLSEECSDGKYKPVFADKKAAFRTDNAIKVVDYSGRTVLEMPQDMSNVLSFSFLNDQLAVLTNSGLITIHDDQGNTIRTYSIPTSISTSSYDSNTEYQWNLYGSTLSLSFNNTMYLFDLTQDSPRAAIESGWVYDPKTREVFVRSYFTDSIGIFHLCSTEELIEKGNEIVKEYEIPEEIRNKYGLDN
jgi:hypothetical protein